MPSPLSFWRAFALPLCLALVVVGLAALVLRSPADVDRFNPDAAARARERDRHMATQAVALDSARTALTQKERVVLSTTTRYLKIRDSVFVPVTHTDTVAILDRLPSFLTATDSMHHACTELAESCAVFRVRAESSLAGLTVDRDAWKALAVQRTPSRWDGVKQWAIRGVIAYGAFRLGQAAR